MISFWKKMSQKIYMRKSSKKGENMIQNEIVICLVWDSLKPFEVVILFFLYITNK